MTHVIRYVVIVIMLGAVLSGCQLYSEPESKIQDLSLEMSQLRSIAVACGTSESKIQTMTMKELLTEIQIVLNNPEQYFGHRLSVDELKKISIYLYDREEIIRTINDYNAFIEKIKDKKIIILPSTKQ